MSAKVRVIQLHGQIANKKGLLNNTTMQPVIDKAFQGLKPKANGKPSGYVILDINSPGGSPVESHLIASAIRRKAEETGAQVHAAIGEYGASGGYWLACAGDTISADPMSLVGSIGVIAATFGLDKAIAKLGIERRVYTSGKNKSRLDIFQPEKPEDVSFIQEITGEISDEFKAWVIERRPGLVGAPVFDGSAWTGRHGLELGLVDHLMDVPALARSLAGEKAKTKTFAPKRGFFSRLPFIGASILADALVSRVESSQTLSLA